MVCGRVYIRVRCPSICLPQLSTAAAASGRFAAVGLAGRTYRLLHDWHPRWQHHGGWQQMWVVSCLQLPYKAEHRLALCNEGAVMMWYLQDVQCRPARGRWEHRGLCRRLSNPPSHVVFAHSGRHHLSSQDFGLPRLLLVLSVRGGLSTSWHQCWQHPEGKKLICLLTTPTDRGWCW